MTTLREELAEIIRWRFRSADGKPLNGPSVVQRAMEIADELAPFIEDAVGWDDAAVPAPEREAVRVRDAMEERDRQITEAMQGMAEDEPAVPQARGEG